VSPAVARPEWRRFTDADWDGFCGATPFENGDEPWIADIWCDGEEATVVADAQGMGVYVFEGPHDRWYFLAGGGQQLPGIAERTSHVELVRLGFKCMDAATEVAA